MVDSSMVRKPDSIDLALSDAGKLLGRKGGLSGGKSKSERKRIAARENGKLGGRPKKGKA